MPFSLTEESKCALVRFLERRQLKDRVVALLKDAVEEHELKRGDVTQAKNATYARLIDDIEKAISNDWITEDQVVELLDDSEVAGRQHICVYELPKTGVSAILNALRAPHNQRESTPQLTEFYEIPQSSYARVLRSTNNEVIVKIVGRRRYWRSELDQEKSSADEEWIHRWIEEERSALILKCVRDSRIVQIRVPPREHLATSETGKSVYEFATDVLGSHYAMGNNSWLNRLSLFSITDAYNDLLDNRDDFVLRHDSPESDTAKSRLSKKGSVKDLKDLRDDEMWQFGDGYARKTLRGTWVINDNLIYTHLNLDKVRIGQNTTAEFARIFFPYLSTDAEVDHVIQRIKYHIRQCG